MMTKLPLLPKLVNKLPVLICPVLSISNKKDYIVAVVCMLPYVFATARQA